MTPNTETLGRFRVFVPARNQAYEFFTLAGARTWLDNEKAEGKPIRGSTNLR